MTLYFRQLKLGPMENFVYLIGDLEAKLCVVVDPAWGIDAIINQANQDGMTIIGGLLTHFHPDHCGGHLWGYDIEGAAELVGKTSVPIYANHLEIDGIAKVTGLSRTDITACHGGEEITVGPLKVKTIHTPGHTPGSQCFLINSRLISGDTLFLTGCGRVDLPGGDADLMFESLNTKIAKLAPDTIVCPGHAYDPQGSLPLSDVLKINPYLQVRTMQEWREKFDERHQ